MVISGFFTNSRLDKVMEIVEDMVRSGHFPAKIMFATIMDAHFKAVKKRPMKFFTLF